MPKWLIILISVAVIWVVLNFTTFVSKVNTTMNKVNSVITNQNSNLQQVEQEQGY